MFAVLNFNQLEYTTLLVNSYDSFWDKLYDYLRNAWYSINGKSPEPATQQEALDKLKYEIFREIEKVKQQVKEDFIKKIGRDKFQELNRLHKQISGNVWYDPIFDYTANVRNLDWYDFFTSKYFWIPIGAIIGENLMLIIKVMELNGRRLAFINLNPFILPFIILFIFLN